MLSPRVQNQISSSAIERELDQNSLQRLMELVAIDSQTNNIDGVQRTQNWLSDQLSPLGFKTQYFADPTNTFADLLVGRFGSDPKNDWVTLVMHADTVLGHKEYQSSFEKLKNGRFYGPGVIDNKGGIIVALEGLEHFLRNNDANINIQVVSVPNEEMGSAGFHKVLSQLGKDSKMILGFEPALEGGHIIESRHGNRWYDVRLIGIEAHSGRCKGEELNAAHEWSIKLGEMLKLQQGLDGTKLNVGSIRSRMDKFNVVCGEVDCKIDFRFECNETRDQFHEGFVEILENSYLKNNKGQGVKALYSMADDCPAFKSSNNSKSYGELYLRIINQLEPRVAQICHSGGASDVNYMSHSKAICIDGLGALGGGMHTTEEYIDCGSLETRSRALSYFLQKINHSNLTPEGEEEL